MTADFFRATLTTSSNDVQEKSDHGKKEQVEEAQVEIAADGEGQAKFGKTHVRQEKSCEKEIAADGEEKGSGKEGRQSGAEEKGNAGGTEACRQDGRADAESCAEALSRAEAQTRTDDAGADGYAAFNAGRGAGNASGDEFRRGIIGDVDSAGMSV
jgi:hypothetical protein